MSTSAIDATGNRGKASPRRSGHRWWAWLRLVLLGIVVAGVTGVVMALPLLPTDRVVLEKGYVAPQDIRAPRQITYESALLRVQEQDRLQDERASARVPDSRSRCRTDRGPVSRRLQSALAPRCLKRGLRDKLREDAIPLLSSHPPW